MAYLYIPLRAATNPPLNYADPVTWERFTYLVLGQQFQGTFHKLPSFGGGLSIVWNEVHANLGLGAFLAVAGAVLGAFRNAAFAVLCGLWFLLTFVFALGYENAAIDRYYLVPLMVATIWAALALDAVWTAATNALGRGHPGDGGRQSRTSSPTPFLVTALVGVVLIALVVAPVPGRFRSVDRSHETSARAWLDATLRAVQPNAVIVSWWNYSTPLWYGRWVEVRRPDMTIIDDRTMLDEHLGDPGCGDSDEPDRCMMDVIDGYLDTRPVYLIRLEDDLAGFRERYQLELVPGITNGRIWRVVGRVSDTTP
jgi:hypothetical protein